MDCALQDFKWVILNILQKLKEIMSKELNENVKMMSHQILNIHKRIEIIC